MVFINHCYIFLSLIFSVYCFLDVVALIFQSQRGNDLITKLRSFNFTFSFWDPVNDHVTVHQTIDLIQSAAVDTATHICCNRYPHRQKLEKLDATALYRCLMPTLSTVRLTKLTLISQLVSEYEIFSHDEELFGLLAGYAELGTGREHATLKTDTNDIHTDTFIGAGCEPPISTRQQDDYDFQNEFATCIIGFPTIHSILPALLSKDIGRVLVFSSWFDDKESPMEHSINSNINGSLFGNLRRDLDHLAHQLGKAVNYFSLNDLLDDMLMATIGDLTGMFQGLCSVVQLNGDFEEELIRTRRKSSVVGLRAIADFLMDEGIMEKRVIRIRYKSAVDATQTRDEDGLECLLSTAWHKNTKLRIDDNVGKLILDSEKKYETYFPDPTRRYPDLTTVQLCRVIVRPNSRNTRPQSDIPDPVSKPSYDNNKKDSVLIIITSSMRIFVDNVFGLQYLLQQRLGYRYVYVAAEMNWSLYLQLKDEADRRNALLLHIVVSVVDMSLFGQHAIVYNSEQIVYSAIYEEGMLLYQSLLKDHQFALWSYDNITTHHWKHHIFPNNSFQIFEVPYCYSPNRLHVLQNIFTQEYLKSRNPGTTSKELSPSALLHNRLPLHTLVAVADSSVPLFTYEQIEAIHAHEEATSDQHQYAIFFGSKTQRRHEITASLELMFLEAHLIGSLPAHLKFYNFFGKLVLDYTRDYFLFHSKIVINIASSEKSVLETHRINHLLSLKKIIVSEKGSDPSVVGAYEPAVIFVDGGAHEIFQVVTRLMQDEAAFQQQLQHVLDFYESRLLPVCEKLTDVAIRSTISAKV